MALLNIFANNLLPILLLGGAGFALGKILSIEARPLGRVVFYVLSPVLVFNQLTQNQLSFGSIMKMMAYAATVMLVGAGLAYLAGRLLRLERTVLSAVVLTTLIANNGNYGLPLIGFAFGQEALAYASVYYVTNSLMIYTVGVLIASLGQLSLKEALRSLLRVPAIYAIILAMVFVRAGWQPPDPLQRTISLASGATIPVMLIVLGLELTRVEWGHSVRAVGIPVFLRLIVGPLIGLGAALLFGLNGVARQDGITDAGMPPAVMATMLAAEYRLEPSLVTAIVFVGTLLSPLTLTPLLYFLGR